MKKFYRTISLALAVLAVMMCFCGCGNSASNEEKVSKPGAKEETVSEAENAVGIANDISIEDIAWNVDEGIVDGERAVLLSYTNNSQYTVVGFDIEFKEKDGITEEEKAQYFRDMMIRFNINENDVSDMENFELVKARPITMHSESEAVTKPGESAFPVGCQYYGGYYDVLDINHYMLVIPDIATIRYIDDGKVKTVYYDFASDKYTADNKTENAYYWTAKSLKDVIAKPKADYVAKDGVDNDECFMFEVYGWSMDQFNDYVQICRESGFTENVREHDGFYSADNSEGFNVHLNYDEDDCSMGGTVRKIDNGSGE